MDVNNVPFFGVFISVLFDRIYRIFMIYLFSHFPDGIEKVNRLRR